MPQPPTFETGLQKERPDHEALMKLLQVPDTERQRWARDLMPLITEALPAPDASKVTASTLPIVKIQHAELEPQRKKIDDIFKDILRHKYEPTEEERDKIWIELAGYLVRSHSYRQLVNGRNIPETLSLPEFLLKKSKIDTVGNLTLNTSSLLLKMQYDVMEHFTMADEQTPAMLAPEAISIATFAVQRQVPASLIAACLDAKDVPVLVDKPYQEFLNAAGIEEPSPSHLQGAKLLVGFAAKGMKRLRRIAEKEKKELKSYTITHLMGSVLSMPETGPVIEELVQSMQRLELPNAEAVFKKAKEMSHYPNEMFEAALEPFAEGYPADKQDVFRHDAVSVGTFFAADPNAERVLLKDMDRIVGHLPPQQLKMAEGIRKNVASKKTVDLLLTSALVPANDKDRDPIEKEVATILTDLLLNQKISCHDAFTIYYTLETVGPNPYTGYKIVQILRKYGHRKTAEEFNVFFILDRMASIVLSAANIDDFLSKVELSDPQRREMRNVLLYLRDSGVGVAEAFGDKLLALIKRHPVLALIFGSPYIYTGYRVIRRGAGATFGAMRRYNEAGIEKFINMSDEQLKKEYGEERFEEMSAAREGARQLYSDYQNNLKRLNPFANFGRAGRINAYIRTLEEGDLTATFKSLKKEGIGESMRILYPYAKTEAQLRSAAIAAGYPAAQVDAAIAEARKATVAGDMETLRLCDLAKEMRQGNKTITEIVRSLVVQTGDPDVMAAALLDVGFAETDIRGAINLVASRQADALRRAGSSIGPSDPAYTLGRIYQAAGEVNIDMRRAADIREQIRANTDIRAGGRRG